MQVWRLEVRRGFSLLSVRHRSASPSHPGLWTIPGGPGPGEGQRWGGRCSMTLKSDLYSALNREPSHGLRRESRHGALILPMSQV